MRRPARTHNAQQLRQSIDAGKGRDKIPFPDPAAAPLGTDDEAAGTPITEEQAGMAMVDETRGPGGKPASTAMLPVEDTQPSPWPRIAVWAGLAVLVVVVLLLWLW